jgi:hypothetical protein
MLLSPAATPPQCCCEYQLPEGMKRHKKLLLTPQTVSRGPSSMHWSRRATCNHQGRRALRSAAAEVQLTAKAVHCSQMTAHSGRWGTHHPMGNALDSLGSCGMQVQWHFLPLIAI